MTVLESMKKRLADIEKYSRMKQVIEKSLMDESILKRYKFVGEISEGLLFKEGEQFIVVSVKFKKENYDPTSAFEYKKWQDEGIERLIKNLKSKIEIYEEQG